MARYFNQIKYILVTFAVVISSCSSNSKDEECLKTITVQQYYFYNNQSYSYDYELEVSCDFPDPEPVELVEPPKLENFTYDVLQFEYTPDTGNNTTRLQFEIRLNNPNDYEVSGFPVLTINSDGIEFSTNYGISSCNTIVANSSCTITFDVEESRDLGFAETFELLDVKYYLTD